MSRYVTLADYEGLEGLRLSLREGLGNIEYAPFVPFAENSNVVPLRPNPEKRFDHVMPHFCATLLAKSRFVLKDGQPPDEALTKEFLRAADVTLIQRFKEVAADIKFDQTILFHHKISDFSDRICGLRTFLDPTDSFLNNKKRNIFRYPVVNVTSRGIDISIHPFLITRQRDMPKTDGMMIVGRVLTKYFGWVDNDTEAAAFPYRLAAVSIYPVDPEKHQPALDKEIRLITPTEALMLKKLGQSLQDMNQSLLGIPEFQRHMAEWLSLIEAGNNIIGQATANFKKEDFPYVVSI